MSSSAVRWLIVVAALAGASGVIIGAFGAHGLSGFLEDRGASAELLEKRLAQFDTGARYHLVHAVALLALVGIRPGRPRVLQGVAILFVAGIVLFSGSLYLLVLTNTPWLGAVTPLGGVAWIVAWALLAFCRPVAAVD
ncbi:DUF423 domain-containing protein [Roseiconus nitratireducens]|uniref:DUF423 domain-containing protein n=1 Tax=Roseiconus nitratireducens TaxID=2605748 RepID=A0A5M6DDI9_9BACT|nr:DUF423 domain-containing protein [Roseiconus nitratireducens]KAA5543245.1 DUF423 domain-containing protein [Roseiconus nitratireducens]